MTTTITAEEFLGRTVLDDQQGSRRIGDYRAGVKFPTIERLFAANMDKRQEVAKLIEDVRARGCQIHFEHNSHQRNYSPRIWITGTTHAVLRATAMIVTNHKPDEMSVSGPAQDGVCTAEFWWD